MKTYTVPYYPAFRCIADQCKNSCCVGWEIDVDSDTAKRYTTLPGMLGEKMKRVLEFDEEGNAFFRLDEAERCPFLCKDGLCELIRTHGEEVLCDICTLHPRFRNDFAGRCEVGIGFCCEAAVALALSYPDCPLPIESSPIHRISLEETDVEIDPFEADLLSLRDSLMIRLYDAERPLSRVLLEIAEACSLAFPSLAIGTLVDLLHQCNQLDPSWHDCIAVLLHDTRHPFSISICAFEHELRAFCAYLIFRHLPSATDSTEILLRVAFALLSVFFISALHTASASPTKDSLSAIIRAFSSEIEYDTDNLDHIYDFLYENMEFTES